MLRFRCLCAVLLILCIELAHHASGWSGADAYTIVLLDGFDTDVTLQDRFYNDPNGTIFTVARNGYRLLDEGVDVPTAAGETSPVSFYAMDERLTTSAAYRGVRAHDTALPFRCRLSGEWVLWTREQPRRDRAESRDRPSGAAGPVDAEPLLLHCRLPLPQNRTEQALRQRRYVTHHHAAMSAALETWWHTSANAQASRCLYGDGEKALTGAARYYELCPTGAVYRIQHTRLERLLQTSAGIARSNVLEFLHTMHRTPSERRDVLQSPRYAGVFEEIGHYHPRLSRPQWNAEYLTWESWYPSTNPCTTHYTTLSDFAGAGPGQGSAASRSGAAPRKVRPHDAYWKTVVRFRCPSQFSARETKTLSLWSVTEARQLCEYHVEVTTHLVCGWEQELDSFHANPIPCVLVN
ncbi:hypothetical protein NESM_000316300 [Novymonas esmeraldas]|uniref:Uncharacterized protein n=1 Tax=Novymonas esmeraldas TaxID=1808958 RepID=A0AAW0ELL9_9TRYP